MEENPLSETFVVLVSNLTKNSPLKCLTEPKQAFNYFNSELLDSRQV